MKKTFCAFCYFLFLIFAVFPQDSEVVNQVLLPLEVFVGDHAEIRYTFRSAIDFFPGDENVEQRELANPFIGLEDKFSVIKAELYRTDMEYTVRFVIIPWKTGAITFPSFNLNTALGITSSDSQDKAGADEIDEPQFFVSLEPVHVKSIVEKTGSNQMMPPVPPIIIPGTTYVIFLFFFLAVVFFILFLRILLKFNSIRRKWNLYLQKRRYKKNAEETLKKIKKLSKNTKLTDIEFCYELQSIMRNYLEFRFDCKFTSISSNSIRSSFEKIFAGTIPSEIAFAVEDITAMFVRTDYIRYAHDSIDSRLYPPSEHQAALVESERKTLSDMIVKAINCFENSEEQLEENYVS
ncbi:MAG: hypothetical protein ACI4LX_11275 [Treponema sp.]